MEPVTLLALIVLGSGAGILGALFGLGGGIIFIPVLMLAFGLPPMEAAAVSLVGIIAGSLGASSVYIGQGRSNIRLGLLLEIAATVGAITGAILATICEEWILTFVFCMVVVYSGIRMALNPEKIVTPSDSESRMSFEYTSEDGTTVPYEAQHIPAGCLGSVFSGLVSSMTGVGGGAINVPVMNLLMHVPIKAASATSNYIIGLTAFSGAIVYFLADIMNMEFAGGLAIGAFVGSLIGTYLSKRIDTKHFKRYFSVVMFAIAAIMFLHMGGIL